MDDFWGFTPGFSPDAPPSEGPQGRVQPHQSTTHTVLRGYYRAWIGCIYQIRRACPGTWSTRYQDGGVEVLHHPPRRIHNSYDPPCAGFRSPATNPTAPHAPRATCTWPCTAIAALAALLMVVGRRLRFYGSSRCTCERPEKGPCFAFRPPSFPCAYAGSDGCPVFIRETSPVKWCGLYTGAAVRGRSVPLEEVHLAEIQA